MAGSRSRRWSGCGRCPDCRPACPRDEDAVRATLHLGDDIGYELPQFGDQREDVLSQAQRIG